MPSEPLLGPRRPVKQKPSREVDVVAMNTQQVKVAAHRWCRHIRLTAISALERSENPSVPSPNLPFFVRSETLKATFHYAQNLTKRPTMSRTPLGNRPPDPSFRRPDLPGPSTHMTRGKPTSRKGPWRGQQRRSRPQKSP
ncbi:hypothetical protein GWK47_033100 [Chionoecetes opilio]|uniref:Uncharacterized protein n=1 Tax=Chionoecetes opilio TaxID=41210 RepID=A0A8J5D451_CHIOP|nr:hypothetical protein GWK47_033100 [Chionoecetes opilio]